MVACLQLNFITQLVKALFSHVTMDLKLEVLKCSNASKMANGAHQFLSAYHLKLRRIIQEWRVRQKLLDFFKIFFCNEQLITSEEKYQNFVIDIKKRK